MLLVATSDLVQYILRKMQVAYLQTIEFVGHPRVLIFLPFVFFWVKGKNGITVITIGAKASKNHYLSSTVTPWPFLLIGMDAKIVH